MSTYLNNITPDSLSGIIFALEGISRTAVLLNGPTGCKFYHSSVADNQTIKQFEFDPLNYPDKWYFGQPRLPSRQKHEPIICHIASFFRGLNTFTALAVTIWQRIRRLLIK